MDNYDRLIDYYEKYITPTLKKRQKESKAYKKQNVIEKARFICKVRKLDYIEADGKIILGDEELEVVRICFENMYKFYNNEIEFYTKKDISEIFNITEKTARNVLNENFACFFRGKSYAYKENLDKIAVSINGYIEKNEMINIIRQELINKNISQKISKFFIEQRILKNCEKIQHPFKKATLVKEEDIPKVLEIIENDFLKMENKIIYNKEKGVKIEIKDDKILTEKYYTRDQMFKLFAHNEVTQIEQEIGFYYWGNEYFYNRIYSKKEVDKIIKEVKQFIPLIECVKDLKSDRDTVKRNFAKLNMKIYRGGEVLGLSYLLEPKLGYTNKVFVRKEDKEKLKEYREKKEEIENAKSGYQKFILKTRDIQYDDNIKNTMSYYNDFVKYRCEVRKKIDGCFFTLYKILVENLSKELTNYNDDEIKELLEKIDISDAQREITNFINFVKEKYLTKYTETYKYKKTKYKDKDKRIEPYSKKQWIGLGSLIFDTSKTSFIEQLNRAVNNRSCAMIWLYCALHYVCTWRKDDILEQIPNPKLEILGLHEYEFINTIKDGSFNISMAQTLVNELIKNINTFNKTPNKTTKNGKGKAFLKITIQEGYVFIIGLLLGLCEAHRRISYKESPKLITKNAMYKYENYINLFGEKYSELFSENFSNVRAIKSHLQYGKMFIKKSYSNHVLSVYSGYNLMSILKSHSRINSFNEITDTTEIYLMSELNEFDFDKVMFCIEERGVFGYLYHQMSKIILGEDYSKESIEYQNDLIFKELPMNNPVQIEKISKSVTENKLIIDEMLNKLIINKNTENEINVKDILISLARGECPSKMEYSQCILKSIDSKKCIYPNRTDCIGCQYLIPEILFLIEFNKKLNNLLDNAKKSIYEFDKERYMYTLNNIYIPILAEAIKYLGMNRVDTFINRKELYTTLKDLKLIKGR